MFRILVGLYATVWSVVRLPEHLGQLDRRADRWRPVGVLSWLDTPPADAVLATLAIATPALALAFTLGWRHRLLAPVFALALLALATLDSSWGQVFHTENLMVMHVLLLALAPAADALALERPRGRVHRVDDQDRYGWTLRLAAWVVVLTYLLAGVAKVRIAGLGWLDGDVLRHLVAHDNLRKAVLGDPHSPLGTALVAHAWVFTPLAVVTVLVELGAPLAMLGGRWRSTWVAAAWGFHVGVLALMAVLFAYPLVGVAFAPFFALERLVPGRWRWRSDREDAVHDEVDAAEHGEGGEGARCRVEHH